MFLSKELFHHVGTHIPTRKELMTVIDKTNTSVALPNLDKLLTHCNACLRNEIDEVNIDDLDLVVYRSNRPDLRAIFEEGIRDVYTTFIRARQLKSPEIMNILGQVIVYTYGAIICRPSLAFDFIARRKSVSVQSNHTWASAGMLLDIIHNKEYTEDKLKELTCSTSWGTHWSDGEVTMVAAALQDHRMFIRGSRLTPTAWEVGVIGFSTFVSHVGVCKAILGGMGARPNGAKYIICRIVGKLKMLGVVKLPDDANIRATAPTTADVIRQLDAIQYNLEYPIAGSTKSITPVVWQYRNNTGELPCERTEAIDHMLYLLDRIWIEVDKVDCKYVNPYVQSTLECIDKLMGSITRYVWGNDMRKYYLEGLAKLKASEGKIEGDFYERLPDWEACITDFFEKYGTSKEEYKSCPSHLDAVAMGSVMGAVRRACAYVHAKEHFDN